MLKFNIIQKFIMQLIYIILSKNFKYLKLIDKFFLLNYNLNSLKITNIITNKVVQSIKTNKVGKKRLKF